MNDASASDAVARPGKGLLGELDAPTEYVPLLTDFVVGGWVIHERLAVDRVLVTVDGEVAAHARADVPRPDVEVFHPAAAGTGPHGWTVTVPALPAVAGDSVTIEAYAHVEARGSVDAGSRDQARLGPWVRFAALALPVVPTGTSFGHVDQPHDMPIGVVRVTGQAWAPGGLARVELAAGDGPWIRARHSQPGRARMQAPGPWGQLDASSSGFIGYISTPDQGTVTIRATAVALDGRRHDLDPVHVEIGEATAPSTSPVRAGTLREHFDDRIGRLRQDTGGRTPILVAAHSLDVGGAQLYLSLLLERLTERGLSFVVASRSAGSLLADLEAGGVPVLIYGTDPGGRETLEGQILQVAEFAHEHGAVACLANSLPSFPAVVAAQRLGLPTTWAIHESFDLDVFWTETFGHVLASDVDELVESALVNCDDVVFEAESTMHLYQGLVPAAARSLVPYGVDSTGIDRFRGDINFDRARADLGLTDHTLVLACVGTVEARKGQLALLRAFARIAPDRRRGVLLVIVGMNDSPYAEALRVFAEDAGLTDAVLLQDVTRNIYPWYAAADVLVSASDIESVPRSMLESMLMGRPVAATAAFGVADLVTEEVTGFLCEPLDLGSLQEMLERVIRTDRSQLAEMGRAARAHVVEHHDPAGYINHFEGRLSSWMRG